MFCPKCGKKMSDQTTVCTNCNFALANINLYDDVTDSYSKSSPSTMTKRKQAHLKRILIISVSMVLIITISIVSFFAISDAVSTNFMHNNPTKYTLAAYSNSWNSFLNNSNVTNVISNLNNSGTVSETYSDIDYNYIQTFSYDINKNEFYGIRDRFNEHLQYPRNKIELYTDVQNLVCEYDINGTTGNGYINSENLSKDADKSIFAPFNENVLNMNSEQYDMSIDTYKYIYQSLSKSENDKFGINTSLENIISSLENESKIEIKEDSLFIDGNKRSINLITYEMNHDDVGGVLKTLFKEIRHITDINADVSSKVSSWADSGYDSFENDGSKDCEVVINNYIDKSTHNIVKIDFNLSYIDRYEKTNNIDLIIDYNNNDKINIECTDKCGEYINRTNIELSRIEDDDYCTYEMNIKNRRSSYSNDTYIYNIKFNSNKKTNEFNITYDSSDSETKNRILLKGKAEITSTLIKLNTSYPMFNMLDENTGNLDDLLPFLRLINREDPSALNESLSYSFYISSEPQIKQLTSDKNLFDMTVEEYNDLKKENYYK